MAVALDRNKEIQRILGELQALRKKPSTEHAVRENIRFFKSIHNPWRYFKWLFTDALKITNTEDLFEINELLPKYDEQMHRALVSVERANFPGLVRPLVQVLYTAITEVGRGVVLLGLGAGGMETERQLINLLHEKEWDRPVLFVSVDRSLEAHSFARKNLSESAAKVFFAGELSTGSIATWRENSGITVVQCTNDIFALEQHFGASIFDISYSSLFLHHLTHTQQETLVRSLEKISKLVLMYDGYRSALQLIPQSIVAWHNPVLMNASVFSGLRYRLPKEVRVFARDIQWCRGQGTYLARFSAVGSHV